MNQHSQSDRARDVDLVADAITNAVKLALPGIVRKEVELQLGVRETQPRSMQVGKSPGSQHREGSK